MAMANLMSDLSLDERSLGLGDNIENTDQVSTAATTKQSNGHQNATSQLVSFLALHPCTQRCAQTNVVRHRNAASATDI